MDLIWRAVAIAGRLALAGCVASALLLKPSAAPDEFTPLANTGRLTGCPRAPARRPRRRTMAAVVAMVTLTVAFVASALVAARPTGLPSWNRATHVVTPEDTRLVCVRRPADRSRGQRHTAVLRRSGPARSAPNGSG